MPMFIAVPTYSAGQSSKLGSCQVTLDGPLHAAKTVSEADYLCLVLAARGYTVERPVWNDPLVDWKRFQFVVIRETWDYNEHFEAYQCWIRHVDAVSVLLNPAKLILWNMEKSVYLQQLSAEPAIEVIPTLSVEQRDWELMKPAVAASSDLVSSIKQHFDSSVKSWLPQYREFVVKPSVSLAGCSTARFSRSDTSIIAHVEQCFATSPGVLIQPLMESIFEGENSLIYLAGGFSHGILKKNSTNNEFRVQTHYGGSVHPMDPTPDMLRFGSGVLDAVVKNAGLKEVSEITYARIDFVWEHGVPMLMECEMIECELMLPLIPGATEKFCHVLESCFKAHLPLLVGR
ncbi:hypothetical protein HDV03_004640 [Kappamyces sp. JEL0829]|nr:hypothetical protein HDV03_004640 [Kappamyces sp. JEL0829]